MTNRRQEIEARAEQRAQDITVPNLAKVNIQINDIDPDPNQPRESFMEHRLQELSESLAANGVLVPIIVRRHPNQPNRYVIVDGEQRWRASQLANKTDVTAQQEFAIPGKLRTSNQTTAQTALS